MTKLKLVPAPPKGKSLLDYKPSNPYFIGTVGPGLRYLVPISGGISPKDAAPTSSASKPEAPKN